MAKALLACYKNTVPEQLDSIAHEICERIKPDNCFATAPRVVIENKVLSVVYNPSASLTTQGCNICLGVCDDESQIFEVGAELPNGSYALFKVGESKLEIASDFASSRTLWYYNDDEVFIASTSQRMIISLLGNFQINKKACAWFLSSGTLGPRLSWDKRIKMVEPRTRLLFDRTAWKLVVNKDISYDFENSVEFKSEDSFHRENFENIVESSIKSLKLNPSQWTLALSGGMDSRGLLYHLRDKKLNTVTWGHSKALKTSLTDAQIAKMLAKYCEIDNEYAQMDFKNGSFSSTIDRFISAGEGRLDHLAAYFDGLKIWGNLSKKGRGVIRGYDAFGRKPPVTNSFQVFRNCNLLISSYASPIIPKSFRVGEEDIPKDLHRKKNESLENWRDRLWLQHRTPITTAALEDIKLSYVEVINPLLNKNIVQAVQNLPIKLRNNKSIWYSIVSKMFPEIPFAKREAVEEVGEVLSLPEVRDYICQGLSTYESNQIFEKEFIELLVNSYTEDKERYDIKRRLRRLVLAYLPKKAENLIRSRLKPSRVSNKWIAFRVLMILKVNEMYLKDAMLIRTKKMVTA
ncbi:MAG: hypothetical protein CML04_11470 [Pseudozobellia sp.]|nr:hypothetical protein [Pseudozobellia sp.]MBG50381.1 hypothetical protein [Pseudozobellia sp.]|tara:strand:- start:119758 stop:121482 length:1725 start_codon:yes stop_codon:yes gene_type:complete